MEEPGGLQSMGSQKSSSAGKETACNAGDPSLIPGLGRSAGEGIGYPPQYSWASLVAQTVKKSACNAEDPGSIPGSGRSPGEGIGYPLQYSWASLVAQTVKNPPGTRETWVRSLGQEYPLEKGMATHSSTLAWRIPLTEAPGGLQSMGSQMTDQLSTCTYLLFGTT